MASVPEAGADWPRAYIRHPCQHRGVRASEPLTDISVSLGFCSKPPSHFVARIGRSGWLEGWGWTIEEALASLAARACELDLALVLEQAGRDQASVVAWLAARAPVPTLEG